MEGPRAILPQEHQSLFNFLNQNLRKESAWSILQEYPTAFSSQNMQNVRVIVDPQNHILSHAVFRPTIVKTELGLFKAAPIGSVVTDSQSRDQGLSQSILRDCLTQAQNQGCEFAILWTNLHDFYRKLGFELAGNEATYSINRDLPVQASDLIIRETNKIDPAALMRVYSQHTVSAIRTLEEFRKYLEIPNSRIFTAWDKQGLLQAYIVEGKGADLGSYIHEWGGGVSKLFQLVQALRKSQNNKDLTWMVPAHAEGLHRALKDAGFQSQQGFLGMIKILNPTSLFSKINRYAKQVEGLADFHMEFRHPNYTFTINGEVFQTQSEADMIRLIFGPQTPSQLASFQSATLTALDKIFPIKMWFWGWDSI